LRDADGEELAGSSEGRASDLLVECLQTEGVDRVFGIPGEETLDCSRSLDGSPIDFVAVRGSRRTRTGGAVHMPVTADQERSVVDSVPRGLLVGGTWRGASGGGTLAVEDPSTGEPIASVADATPDDARAALDAAVAMRDEWAAHPPRERGEILRRAFERIIERRSQLALLMTLEMGKPLAESEAEVAYAAEFFRWFSEEAVRVDGRFATAPDGRGRLLTIRQPVGPCYMITPWNFPMAMGTRKIGPAVAAGCTMVVKPAQRTPLSMLALAGILEDAGLPGGVLNVLTTSSSSAVSEPIMSDPRLRKLSFTGSTAVGRKLMEQSAENLLRVSMELGGNAPFLVFDDADVEDAVEGALIAKMRNVGEACTAANRFHVAAPLAGRFAERLAQRMGDMRVGRGTEDGVQVGPLIDGEQRAKVAELVGDATARGADVMVGGSERDGPGYFYEPTVLTDIPPDARLLKEEIFGPVAPVASFHDEEAALAAANDTESGLVAYVYTRDIKRALRVCEALQTGMVGLNQGMVSNPAAPFGGVKQSGFGREGGREGISEYLEYKYVAMAM
jgi:succinate-semialdehyde dehydrogenase/glutarate-semialdehyde dehydrogenase